MKNNIIKIITIILLALVIFFAGYVAGNKKTSSTFSSQTLKNYSEEVVQVDRAGIASGSSKKDGESVRLMFDFGSGNSIDKNIVYDGEQTLAEVLVKLEEEKAITLETINYGKDLGLFVAKINGVGGGKDMWWQYWTNGTYGTVGISNYIVKPNDVIQFIYDKSYIQ